MKNEEKKHENSELKLSLNETEEIIGRLKEALNVKSDGQLANNLGISRQNIGAARKRDDVPPGWIYKVAELSGCSMDWLHFGHGPKVRVEYTAEGSKPKGELASQESPYKLQVSSTKSCLGHSLGAIKSLYMQAHDPHGKVRSNSPSFRGDQMKRR